MKIDITSLFVERTSDTHVRIALKKATGEYAEWHSFFCISNKEWPMVRACMLGIADFYPYFDDCSYLLKFYPSGMRVAYIDRREMDYFTFPTGELVEYIDYQFQVGANWREEIGFKPKLDFTDRIAQWQEQYGPNVIVNIEPEVKERLMSDIQHPRLSKPGKDLIADLVQWAGQYSDGNPVSVNIYFDSSWDVKHHPEIPASYYWTIWEVEKNYRIVNGGYIAHCCDYPAKDDSLYEYSMHT